MLSAERLEAIEQRSGFVPEEKAAGETPKRNNAISEKLRCVLIKPCDGEAAQDGK
jgi:hypothetical protein